MRSVHQDDLINNLTEIMSRCLLGLLAFLAEMLTNQ